MTHLQVHLTTWALDDGAVPPFALGERIELGLGIAVEQLPIAAEPEDTDGVFSLLTPAEWARVRARADVVGLIRLVVDDAGTPFSAFVTPLPGVPLVLVGPGVVDPAWDGHRLIVRGDVVVEPYLWADGGVVRASISTPIRTAVVDRIQTVATTADTDAFAPLTDVAETVPHRQNPADYLLFDP